MAIKTYPLNNIDYQAEDAELFHCTRTSGVYASGHFSVSVTGADNNITVGKGIGWIKNTEFSGKVFASKEETTLNAGVPDASLPRIDAVVLRFDANQNETYFTIKQGSTGSAPTPPEVERGEYIYELHLYHIRRRPGATAITPGDITDLRMDANYCGLMADSVTQVDMSAINAQVREFISDWENQIANVTDGKMIEAPEYPGCYYRMNRGVKEWMNPPMMEDVEYATTKRQDGKRVYTKLLKARSMAGSVSLPDIERIVSVSAVAERDWNGEKLMFQLPVDYLPKDTKEIQKMQIYYQENRIVFQSVVAKGTYDLYITVEYTKPGDEVAYTNVTADGDNMIVETSGDSSTQGDNLNVEMFTEVSAEHDEYIRRLTINGTTYNLAVGQAGIGSPGTAYPGVPGQFYTDLDSGEVYVCMGGSADAGVYIWRTIIPPNLSVNTLQINHKTGIGSATINASQGAVLVQNNGQDAIISGVATPARENDAANKKYVDESVEELWAEIRYVPIEITSISNGAGTQELGAVLDSVDVRWGLNKAPTRQSVNGVEVQVEDRTVTVAGPFSATTKFTLAVADEREAEDTASTTVNFYPGIYYGALAAGTTVEDTTILSLTRKLQGSRETTFTVDASGKRPVFACPTRYGTPKFIIGGFEYTWTKLADAHQFVNVSGHREAYDVWQHGQDVSGTITVTVS